MASAIHISLNVSNFESSTDFYRRFFGEPKKLKPGYAKFVVQDPEIHLALQPGTVSGPGALSHLGIRVDSATRVHEWQGLLNERGLPTEEEKQEACCYALQKKFWVSDPDGNRWEIYTVLEDIEDKSAAATTCCPTKSESSESSESAAKGAASPTASACC